MERRHYLAAELFAYSFVNYDDHLGIGNARFERIMPDEAVLLEQAEDEGWDDRTISEVLKVELERVPDLRKAFRRARAVVDAEDPAASFRNGVRFSIEDAVEYGLDDPAAIERLVTQICYRAADLAFLLEREGKVLSDYSEALRWEPENGFDLELLE